MNSPSKVVHFPWVDSLEENERTERGHPNRKERKLARMAQRPPRVPREVKVFETRKWLLETNNHPRLVEKYQEGGKALP